jgi:SepF-like predicted cell division protein (DUF552 family)
MVELELEHLRQGKEELGAVIEHMRSTNKKLEDDLRQVCQCVSVLVEGICSLQAAFCL